MTHTSCSCLHIEYRIWRMMTDISQYSWYYVNVSIFPWYNYWIVTRSSTGTVLPVTLHTIPARIPSKLELLLTDCAGSWHTSTSRIPVAACRETARWFTACNGTGGTSSAGRTWGITLEGAMHGHDAGVIPGHETAHRPCGYCRIEPLNEPWFSHGHWVMAS